MTNIEIVQALIVFVLIWVAIAFVSTVVIKVGMKGWKKLKDKWNPEDPKP